MQRQLRHLLALHACPANKTHTTKQTCSQRAPHLQSQLHHLPEVVPIEGRQGGVPLAGLDDVIDVVQVLQQQHPAAEHFVNKSMIGCMLYTVWRCSSRNHAGSSRNEDMQCISSKRGNYAIYLYVLRNSPERVGFQHLDVRLPLPVAPRNCTPIQANKTLQVFE